MSSLNSNYITGRCEYLDCIKGLAILCIVFLHFENGVIPVWLNEWIGLFMISTFYFTSGWVFGLKPYMESPKELFNKRLRQLGKPYLWFGLLILLFDLIWYCFGLMSFHILGREIYKFITLRGIGTLWFLPVLFGGEILFCFIKKSQRPWLYGSLLFIITIIIGYIYYTNWTPLLGNHVMYQLIDSPIRPIVMTLGAWPVIMAGYQISRRYSNFINTTRKWITAIIGIVLLIISIWFVIYPPFHIYYINGFISNILPVIGFMGIFVLISRSWIGSFFKYWGKNSLILMCTHFSITMELFMAFDIYVLHHREFSGPRTIIYFIICIILTYPIVILFNRRLNFMLGKNKKIVQNG